jgi:hypothetical protein
MQRIIAILYEKYVFLPFITPLISVARGDLLFPSIRIPFHEVLVSDSTEYGQTWLPYKCADWSRILPLSPSSNPCESMAVPRLCLLGWSMTVPRLWLIGWNRRSFRNLCMQFRHVFRKIRGRNMNSRYQSMHTIPSCVPKDAYNSVMCSARLLSETWIVALNQCIQFHNVFRKALGRNMNSHYQSMHTIPQCVPQDSWQKHE